MWLRELQKARKIALQVVPLLLWRGSCHALEDLCWKTCYAPNVLATGFIGHSVATSRKETSCVGELLTANLCGNSLLQILVFRPRAHAQMV